MNEIFFTVEVDDDGYTANAENHGIFTEADDLDTLREMIKDAVACHFEEMQFPKLIHLNILSDRSAWGYCWCYSLLKPRKT